MAYVLLGSALMVFGVELYLESGQWPYLISVAAGLAIVGWPRSVNVRRDIVLRLSALLAFSLYFTLTAFYRYRGLAKDIDPTAAQLTLYFLRIALASMISVGLVSVLRAGVTRFRASQEAAGKGD